jgi:hypothetical protein
MTEVADELLALLFRIEDPLSKLVPENGYPD